MLYEFKKAVLPGRLPENLNLEAKGKVTVIASVPTFASLGGATWETIRDNLLVYREIGVDTMALWPIWKHIPPIDAITVKTAKGNVRLRLHPHVTWWTPKDYLELNPELGSRSEFSNMVKEAHSMGIKVVPVLQVSYTLPGGYIYEEHPEWIIKSIYGGYAITWPWARCPWGYVLDKSNPELIEFITETVLPHWIEVWGVDGVWLDSPPVWTCDSRIREICSRLQCAEGCECLTPVENIYTAEPLVRSMRKKVDELEAELGRELVCAGENSLSGYLGIPDKYLEALCRRQFKRAMDALFDPEVKGGLDKYWDWICDYRFRLVLMSIYKRGKYSFSSNYVDLFKFENSLMDRKTDPARLVNMLNNFNVFRCLHTRETAECYITLAATAPGRTLWIAAHHIGKTGVDLPERRILEAWYRRLVRIKRAYTALQNRNIEGALLKPRIEGLIAYNRWDNEESVTIIVNTRDEPQTVTVKTKFQGGKADLIDLLHGGRIAGDPSGIEVKMPPLTAMVLVEPP